MADIARPAWLTPWTMTQTNGIGTNYTVRLHGT